MANINELIDDWPSGPLDEYRKRATFNWKQMKLLLEGEDQIKLSKKIFSTLEKDPLFKHTPWEEMDRDEYRRLTFLRMKRLCEYDFVNEDVFIQNPRTAIVSGLTGAAFDLSLCGKKFVAVENFIGLARTGGTSKQIEFINNVKQLKAFGCISMTELSHGSNPKALRTTATFDVNTQEFILNTPDLEATKVWSGNLGQIATHAVVFAQLYTPDGQCHGLHSFLVPVRDPKTLTTFPGVLVGDMGPKIGLNGIDNGFMQFTKYRVAKSSLLNRHADVSADGRYTSHVSQRKRRGLSLGMLSAARVAIIMNGCLNLQLAITIAIRYTALRKQFGPEGEQEWPVLEYQTVQWRLIPYIASSYALSIFASSFFDDYINFFISATYGGDGAEQAETGSTIHAVSCCSKSMVGWIVRDGIQECREACGGHGFLKASRFGELRNDHDANNTHEGDNNVLLQQTSNYIIKQYDLKVNDGVKIQSPFAVIDFLNDLENILNLRIDALTATADEVITIYRFLVCWLTKESSNKLKENLAKFNGDLFRAKSETQVFYLRTLAIVFFELRVITRFFRFIRENEMPQNIRDVLNQLGLLYSYWSLQKHVSTLCEASLFKSPKPMRQMKELTLELCMKLKDNAVALVEVFAPPDFFLNSTLGYSDGKLYEHIFEAFINSKNAFTRPYWYTKLSEVPSKAKL